MLQKKYILFFFSILILVSNLGIGFSVHFCNDSIASIQLESVAILNPEEDCCGIEEDDSGCCENKEFKASADTKFLHYKPVFELFYEEFQVEYYFRKPFFEPIVVQDLFVGYFYKVNPPPLYLLFCNFNLYEYLG